MSTALIVVDVQNDFCEGGSLPVRGGAEVALRINQKLCEELDAPPEERQYDVLVATRDHHIDPGTHFSDNPDYAASWPPHCVVGTEGSAFHPNLDPQPFDAIFLKGEHQAAYSGFEGKSADGRHLAEWLRDHSVTQVDICGLTTDYCVRSTALDAAQEGFRSRVLLSLTAGVDQRTSQQAVREMQTAGVAIA